ncbi:POTRA domain-containing protein [Paucihalobacter sp.]|uniref:POTRA domain-containing protein n=1 Tax=Paucihalobacter sp. TaxID=2850405 RepID=UPI002FE2FFC7
MRIIGMDSIETKVVDSLRYSRKHPDFNTINNEVDKQLKLLYKLGYIEAYLKEINQSSDSTFLAQINLKNKFSKVRLYNIHLVNLQLLRPLIINKSDDYFEVAISNLETVLQLVNQDITASGQPFAVVQLQNLIPLDNNIITAYLDIEQNAKRTLDSIIIKGYEKFPKSFLKHQLKLNKNSVFNLERIKKQTANLQNINFANQIKEPEVLFTKDSTILYVYIEKSKVNNFDGFLGFGTNEDTNKIEFDGYLNLNLINNLNYGETLKLLYKSDENEQRTFDVVVRMPYLFKSPIGITGNLNIFRRDSTFLSTTQTLKLDYQIDVKNRFSAGISSLRSDNLLSNTSLFFEDFKSNFYIAEYQHTAPQFYDFLFPVNFYVDISAGIGKRTVSNSDLNQSFLRLNTFKIFNLNERNSIYVRLDGATLISDNYFENELFRFGGINSIRGFEENSLLANLYSVLNTEYRYRLSNALYVHTVLDAAYSENNISNSKDKLFGFGFGFGLLTNAGLFKFNYSSAKTENQQFRLSDSKIHISLTSQF